MQEKIHEAALALWSLVYTDWITDIFSIKWLYLIALTVVAYLIWFKVLDKSRLKELLLIGSFVAVQVAFVDIAGTSMQLWGYKVRILPFMVPPVIMGDFTLFPIAIMIVYQYTSEWRQYLIWSAVVGATLTYILMPFHAWLGIATLYNWSYSLMFLGGFIIAITSRAAYNWVSLIESGSEVVNKKISYLPNMQPAFKKLKK